MNFEFLYNSKSNEFIYVSKYEIGSDLLVLDDGKLTWLIRSDHLQQRYIARYGWSRFKT